MRETNTTFGVQRLNRYLSSLSRSDLVLALIPSTLLLSLAIAYLLGLSHRIAFIGWVLVGVGALCDALFVHPPTAGRRTN